MPIDPVNLKALAAFAESAKEYCDFVESLRIGRPSSLYSKIEAILPELHQAILRVQAEMADADKSGFEPLSMSTAERRDVSRTLAQTVDAEAKALMEHHQGYEEDITRAVMLFDDLAGIYCDLHNGLTLWKSNLPEAQAEAAWQWRWRYENHWGQHLLRAMMTVHEIRYLLFAE